MCANPLPSQNYLKTQMPPSLRRGQARLTRINGRMGLGHTSILLYLLLFLISPLTIIASDLEVISDFIVLDLKPPQLSGIPSVKTQDLRESSGRFKLYWGSIIEPAWGSSAGIELLFSKTRSEVEAGFGSNLSRLGGYNLNQLKNRDTFGLTTGYKNEDLWYFKLKITDQFGNDYLSDIFEKSLTGVGGGYTAPPPVGGTDPGDGGYQPPADPDTYKIQGRIMGSGDYNSLPLRLTGADRKILGTDRNGNYSFTGLSPGNYSVTPFSSRYNFSPIQRDVSITSSDHTAINFTMSAKPPDTTNNITICGIKTEGAGITLSGGKYSGSGSFTIGRYLNLNGSFEADPSQCTQRVNGELTLRVNRKNIFSWSLAHETFDFSIKSLSLGNASSGLTSLYFYGLSFEVSSLFFTIDDLGFERFKFRGRMVFAKNLARPLQKGSRYNSRNAVGFNFLSLNRYIAYSPGSRNPWEIVGNISFSSASGLRIAKGVGLSSGSFTFDTVNREYELDATLSLGHLLQDIRGTIGVNEGWPNTLGIGVENLNKPLGTTGVFFQSIYGAVEDICGWTKKCKRTPTFRIEDLKFSFGPQINDHYMLALALGGTYQFPDKLSGTADVTIINDDMEMAGAEFSYAKNKFSLSGNMDIWGGFIEARGLISYDENAKPKAKRLEGGLSGTIKINKNWPWRVRKAAKLVLGKEAKCAVYMNGTTLKAGVKTWWASAHAVHQWKDSISDWDYDTGWDKDLDITVNPSLMRLVSGLSAGGYMGILSASTVARSFTVSENELGVFISILYTGNGPLTPSLLAPDASRITSSTADGAIRFEKNPEANEHLIVMQSPQPGQWHLDFDDSNLLEYTVEIYGPNSAPLVSLLAPLSPIDVDVSTQTLPVSISAEDSDPLTVSFYLDEDSNTGDGFLIHELENFQGGQTNLNLEIPETLSTGEYFLHIRVDDGQNLPVWDYSPARVTVIATNTMASISGLYLTTQPSGLLVSFEPLGSTTVSHYNIEVIEGTEVSTLGMDPDAQSLLLTDLKPGLTYQVRVQAASENGGVSLFSAPVSAVFQPAGVNQVPVFQDVSIPTAIEGQPWLMTVIAEDPEGESLSYSLLAYPLGMHLDSATGQLQLTVENSHVGVQLVRVEARDPQGASNIFEFELDVFSDLGINLPPSLPGTQVSTTLGSGQTWAYTIQASDPNGDELQYSLTVASGLGVSLNGNIFQIQSPSAGQVDAKVRVSDGSNFVDLHFSITVLAKAPACSVELITLSPVLDTITEFAGSATGGDGSYTYRWGFKGDGVFDSSFQSLSTSSTIFTSVAGIKQVSLQVRDGSGMLGVCSKNILLADSTGNYAPVILAEISPSMAKPGANISMSLENTYDDKTPLDELLFSWDYFGITTDTEGFAFNDYSRILNFPQKGGYPVNIQVKDADGLISEIQLTAVVDEVSLVTTTLATADFGENYNFSLVPDGGQSPYFSYLSAGVLPSGLVYSGNNYSISGIPQLSGSFDFSVTISDSTSPSLSETFNLNLKVRKNDPPEVQLEADRYVVLAGQPISIDLTGTLDDSTPWEDLLVRWECPGCDAEYHYGNQSIQVAFESTGVYTLRAVVKDGDGKTSDGIISVTITDLTLGGLVPSTVNLPATTTGEEFSFSLNPEGGTPPFQTTLHSGVLPSGITLDSINNTLSSTPTTPGTFVFTLLVSDANEPPVTRTFDFQIDVATQPLSEFRLLGDFNGDNQMDESDFLQFVQAWNGEISLGIHDIGSATETMPHWTGDERPDGRLDGFDFYTFAMNWNWARSHPHSQFPGLWHRGGPMIRKLLVSGSEQDININFEINSLATITAGATLFYSFDGGRTYQETSSFSGDRSNLLTDTSYQLIWHSGDDLSSDQPQAQLRLLITDENGNAGSLESPIFKVFQLIPTPADFVVDAGDGSVRISFTEVAGASGYKIYYATHQDLTSTDSYILTTETFALIEGLENDTPYFFAVGALKGTRESPLNQIATVTPNPATPDAPVDLRIEKGDKRITLDWSDTVGADAYWVYVGESSPVSSADMQFSTDLPRFLLAGLENGVEYFFRVRAFNAGGESALSSEVSTIPIISPPGAPLGLSVIGGDGLATLTWNGSVDAVSYEYFYATTSPVTITDLKGSTTSMRTTVTGLTNGEQYFFRVRSLNAGGISPLSSEVSTSPMKLDAQSEGDSGAAFGTTDSLPSEGRCTKDSFDGGRAGFPKAPFSSYQPLISDLNVSQGATEATLQFQGITNVFEGANDFIQGVRSWSVIWRCDENSSASDRWSLLTGLERIHTVSGTTSTLEFTDTFEGSIPNSKYWYLVVGLVSEVEVDQVLDGDPDPRSDAQAFSEALDKYFDRGYFGPWIWSSPLFGWVTFP
jgi:hypothetical protein